MSPCSTLPCTIMVMLAISSGSGLSPKLLKQVRTLPLCLVVMLFSVAVDTSSWSFDTSFSSKSPIIVTKFTEFWLVVISRSPFISQTRVELLTTQVTCNPLPTHTSRKPYAGCRSTEQMFRMHIHKFQKILSVISQSPLLSLHNSSGSKNFFLETNEIYCY